MEKVESELYQTRMGTFLLLGHWILKQEWRLVNYAMQPDPSPFFYWIIIVKVAFMRGSWSLGQFSLAEGITLYENLTVHIENGGNLEM